MWRKMLGCAAVVFFLVLAFVGGTAYWFYSRVRAVPEFYAQAERRHVDPGEQKQLAAAAETQALEVRNAIEAGDDWSLRITNEQANSWLEMELPGKFPKLLPPSSQNPRVRFEKSKVLVGWRQETAVGETVMSLEGDIFLTDDKQEIAAKIVGVHAGGVALPRDRIVSEIRAAAQSKQLAVHFSEQDGAPVMLIPINQFHGRGIPDTLKLEHLELNDDSLFISGRGVE